MSRSAQLSRKTGETDVQISLDLDGNLAGRMTACAARSSSWSAVMTDSAPTCASAFSTLRRLPMP